MNKDKTEIKTLLKIANITGIPSLTIPFAYQKNTPFSLCINGFFFQENNIFKIGKMVEKTSNFKNHAYEKLWNKENEETIKFLNNLLFFLSINKIYLYISYNN